MNMKTIRSPNKYLITGKIGIDKQQIAIYNTYVNKINSTKRSNIMKTLNTKAIFNSPILSREKGEIDEIKNFTLEHVTILESRDGECMVAVTFKESPKRFWASGVFANFIMDNTNTDKVNDTDYDFSGYDIKVSFDGKKTSKNNRKYNSWKISYNQS